MLDNFDMSWFLMVMLALVLGITVHEFAHAITADRLGDPTPRAQGRVNLSPLSHLDPMGSLFMIASTIYGMGIGWGRPVQTQPRFYRINPRIGDALVSFAGPLSNMVLAGIFALVLRSGVLPEEDPFFYLAHVIVQVNVSLFFFNLIPLYPLDGSHLLANAMPPAMAETYYRLMTQFGIMLFLALVMSGALSLIIGPPITHTIRFLIGMG